MKNHLTTEEIATAVAGSELKPDVEEHLAGCVTCRAEVADFETLIDARREEMLIHTPDWDDQARRVMDRLPVRPGAGVQDRPKWLRPVLAVAAVVVLGVGISVLRPDGVVEQPPAGPSVEEILAEMDELLSDDSIPGFEIIDPEMDDLETYFKNGAS